MAHRHQTLSVMAAIAVLAFVVGLADAAPLRTVHVASVDELQRALDSARPGDLILVADGTYETAGPLTLRQSGTAKRPILLRAADQGKAIITGRAGIVLDGADHAVVGGFVFTGEIGTAVKLYGCSHSRVTRNHIRLRERVNGPKMDWVISKYDGERNRIDHNLLEEKRAHGRFVYIHHHRRYDRVDHNHFRDNSLEGDNGRESIVVRGYFTTVEHNLFENCSGEGEIISVKSIYPERPVGRDAPAVNTFRYNTFLDSIGTLCLRQANRCLVEGNHFIARGGPGYTGGVKVYGDDHVIRNNYFEGLTGSEHYAPLVLMHGDADIDYEIAPERYLEGMPS
ncbi:MAG: polysaccharide lyase 6 family protein, partial [Armatimonadota bacterium]